MSVLLPIILRWISSPVCALYWQANGSHALWHLLQFAQKIVASGYSRPFLSQFSGWVGTPVGQNTRSIQAISERAHISRMCGTAKRGERDYFICTAAWGLQNYLFSFESSLHKLSKRIGPRFRLLIGPNKVDVIANHKSSLMQTNQSSRVHISTEEEREDIFRWNRVKFVTCDRNWIWFDQSCDWMVTFGVNQNWKLRHYLWENWKVPNWNISFIWLLVPYSLHASFESMTISKRQSHLGLTVQSLEQKRG